jgi:hypothetical protein
VRAWADLPPRLADCTLMSLSVRASPAVGMSDDNQKSGSFALIVLACSRLIWRAAGCLSLGWESDDGRCVELGSALRPMAWHGSETDDEKYERRGLTFLRLAVGQRERDGLRISTPHIHRRQRATHRWRPRARALAVRAVRSALLEAPVVVA